MDEHPNLMVIQHGSPKRRKSGPPELGHSVKTDSFNVNYVPPHIIDLKLKATDNFMVMQLGPSRALGAFNSDKLKPMQLGPGYPIIGRTGSEFNCKATSTKGVIAFHFNDGYLDDLLGATNNVDKFNFNISRPKFDDHLLQLFRLAHRELTDNEPNALYIEQLLAASIIRALSVYADISKEKHLRVPSNRLERAEEYMQANLHKNLSLDDIAKVAGMSLFHFAHSFKAYFGMPPYKYLQQLRLDKSMAILAREKWSIERISEELGFSSVSNFGSFFRKHTGQSPTSYRQLLLN